jgi:UDP-2,4-diacetamido-2,4,6-trideoxy-beta-L-altropyranose hydrolase
MIRAAFRTDASTVIGTGHLMRCLTLADALRAQGAEIHFVCRLHQGHLCALIEERGFLLHRLPAPSAGSHRTGEGPTHAAWLGATWQEDAEETAAALGDFRPDWLIVDHYGLDARWEKHLRPLAGKVMVIDDLADRVHDCDLLLDQNLVAGQDERYAGRTPDGCSLLLGPTYALLQPDYARLRDRASPRVGPVRRLFVFFGGVDKEGLTLRTVNALLAPDRLDLEADIVLSATSPHFKEVEDRVAGHPDLRLHDRVPSLAPLMLASDLAIGASGATSWERLCLGLPSLVVTVADNQRAIAEELSRQGLVRWLGNSEAVAELAIRSALGELLDTGLDEAWSRKCLQVVDGRGAGRACAALTGNELLRKV